MPARRPIDDQIRALIAASEADWRAQLLAMRRAELEANRAWLTRWQACNPWNPPVA